MPYLRRLNRKERFFLVGFALGNESFRLDDDFREKLSGKAEVAIPEDAFVAMDYHLDWLFAAMTLAATDGAPGSYPNDTGFIKGTQEDIDLLVAFDTDEGSHVILVEVKGVTSWSNCQFRSKVERLDAAFQAPDVSRVTPYLVLMSPVKSKRLCFDWCPSWALDKKGQPRWMKLPVPSDLQKIVRCTKDGDQSVDCEYWTVKPEKTFLGSGD